VLFITLGPPYGLYTAPEASWWAGGDPVVRLLFDVYHLMCTIISVVKVTVFVRLEKQGEEGWEGEEEGWRE